MENIEIYVLDKNLNMVNIVDTYESLIWVNRYNEEGECELYTEATESNLKLFKKDYFLIRTDDKMVCRIEKIQITTDTESGNHLIITGYDIKKILNQRIDRRKCYLNGKAEKALRNIVTSNFAQNNSRGIRDSNGNVIFVVKTDRNLSGSIYDFIEYVNVGEFVKSKCKLHNWGYEITLEESLNGKKFYFDIYKGTDRSASVKFSKDFDNLISTKYTFDNTAFKNTATIYSKVTTDNVDYDQVLFTECASEGIDMYEILVSGNDKQTDISYEELLTMYPNTSSGGSGYITTENNKYVYKLQTLDISIINSQHLSQLQTLYPSGSIVTVSNKNYYRLTNITIASLSKSNPENSDKVSLKTIIININMLSEGYSELVQHKSITEFEGEIEKNITFVYKKDYCLGDEVMIENELGISNKVRITEVTEVCDNNGYSIDMKYEYSE